VTPDVIPDRRDAAIIEEDRRGFFEEGIRIETDLRSGGWVDVETHDAGARRLGLVFPQPFGPHEYRTDRREALIELSVDHAGQVPDQRKVYHFASPRSPFLTV
jgi:hypothetical protein